MATSLEESEKQVWITKMDPDIIWLKVRKKKLRKVG